MHSESQPERNVLPPSRRRKPAIPVALCGCSLVTSARFAERNGRGREGDRADRQPVKRSKPRVGHGVMSNLRGGPARNTCSETPISLSENSMHASIFTIRRRMLQTLRKHGKGIKASPTAKFAVSLWTIVAGPSARRKQPSSQGVADRLFVGGNAGSAKTSPSSVRNPDVWIRGRIMGGPHLGQSPRVNTSPVTDFPMRFLAVVWRPTVGIEFPGLESADDVLFLDGNAGVHQAAVRPPGKAIWK